MKALILVSACLLGDRVRYDGGERATRDPRLLRWQAEGRVVGFCPEVAGGLPIPREPAEIEPGFDGADVLDGRARVLTRSGVDVTAEFVAGAGRALTLAQSQGVVLALLKSRSPSCGRDEVYDGTHAGTLRAGSGVTATLLERNGIPVLDESECDKAAQILSQFDADS